MCHPARHLKEMTTLSAIAAGPKRCLRTHGILLLDSALVRESTVHSVEHEVAVDARNTGILFRTYVIGT